MSHVSDRQICAMMGSFDATQVKLLEKCDVLQAVFAFNYRYPEIAARLNQMRDEIRRGPSSLLIAHGIEFLLELQLQQACKVFGCKVAPEEILKWFNLQESDPRDVRSVPKAEIDNRFFSNFGGGLSAWKEFTPHHLIAVEYSGGHSLPALRWMLPEASLYEDLCLSVNLALDTDSAYGSTDPIPAKTNRLHIRTGILNAYYFVEAYLNGVAYDFFVTHGTTLSQEIQDLLLEWNSEKGRKQWLSFEKKLNQYQKIITGSPHPVVTVTSSKNLQMLLTNGKEFRDAIVHHSPKTDPRTQGSDKVLWLSRLRLEHVLNIADCAIGAVRELNAAFGASGMNLSWLIDRGTDGRFPETVFD